MKKIFLTTLALLPLFFTACNSEDPEKTAAIQRADSLQTIIDAKDGEIDALFEVLNEIETNLSEISSRYSTVNTLKQGNPEMNSRVKGQITDQLAIIDNMLSQNKQKIATLNAKIASLGQENSKLQEFVENLNLRIADQETQISELMNELTISKATIKKLSDNVTDLTKANQEKDDYIAYQTNEANKAYYIVGSFKELKEMGIVNKSGGFIGIGKKQNTSENMDVSKFQTIDRTKVTTIAINQRKAQVISKHPEGSYELIYDENDSKSVAYLTIKDVNAFWRFTDYLVVSSK
jgi:predicted RNA-binding protein with EMAP domain